MVYYYHFVSKLLLSGESCNLNKILYAAKITSPMPQKGHDVRHVVCTEFPLYNAVGLSAMRIPSVLLILNQLSFW